MHLLVLCHLIILIGTLLGSSSPIHAKESIVIQAHSSCFYQFDHVATANDIQDIDQLLRQTGLDWQRTNSQELGHSPLAQWLRVSIEHPQDQTLTRHLTLSNPLIDTIKVFTQIDGKTQQRFTSGKLQPFAERTHRLFSYELTLEPSTTTDVYIYLASISPLNLSACLYTQSELNKTINNDSMIYGFGFGMLLIVFFYSLITVYYEKKKAHLFFCAYIIFAFFNQLTLTGYAYQWLWPESAQWNQFAAPFFSAFVGLFFALFSSEFLDIKHHLKKTYKVMFSIIVINLGIIALTPLIAIGIIPIRTFYFLYPLFILAVVLFWASAIYLWAVLKFQPARFFVFANSILLLLALLTILSRLELLPFPLAIKSWYVLFAITLNILLLAIAISERVKTMQRALERSYANLDQLIESVPGHIVLCDEHLSITKVNQTLINQLGYPKAELLSKPLAQLFAKKVTNQQLLDYFSVLENQEKEECFRTQCGNQYPVMISHTLFYPIDYPQPHHLFIAQSLVAMKKLEQEKELVQKQLIQSQRLETVATMAGGMAHDLKNIFMPISGFATLLLQELELSENHKQMLSNIEQASEKGSALVKQVLTMGRNENEKPLAPIPVKQFIIDHLPLIKNSITDNITLNTQLELEDAKIWADDNQLYQIIQNLCQNAAHAIEDEVGTISIHLYAADTANIPNLPEGEYVCLSVSDTGSGIDPKLIDKIFEPFYTSKGANKGTGLGLAIVYNAVHRALGHIQVDSVLGKGTTFNLYFPKITQKQSLTTSTTKTVPQKGLLGHEKILYVDDEAAINLLMKHSLGKLGYQVTTTQSSLEALDFIKKSQHEFDLVISDHTMPDLSGPELVVEIKKLKPNIPILFVTGQSILMSRAEMDKLGVYDHLSKPVMVNELTRVIRKALESAHSVS